MVEEGFTQQKYVETTENTFSYLKRLQDFLNRHFYKHENYKDMWPISNQPGRFFATAKT